MKTITNRPTKTIPQTGDDLGDGFHVGDLVKVVSGFFKGDYVYTIARERGSFIRGIVVTDKFVGAHSFPFLVRELRYETAEV